MDSARVSARNYDEALTKALIELGTTSDNVDVEIIERGTNGFLGIIGVKPWTLKVTVKKSGDIEVAKKKNTNATKNVSASEATKAAPKVREQKSPIEKKDIEKKDEPVAQKEEVKVEPVETSKAKEEGKETSTEAVDEYTKFYGEDNYESSNKKILTNDELEAVRGVVDGFLNDLFKAMDLPAYANYNFSFKTNELSIVIEGEEDLGVLIGKRGQTLDSLQYILSLVVNKSSESYIRIKLDTENYRKKRKEKLELLAKNIASKVKKTGRFTELEPMNAYERRIIHAVLQGDNMVSTKSVGEEPFRHITIYPKKSFKQNKRSPKREMQ
ncbi:RNA-binding cell elongation regulator Jag/EloR [Lachnoanaerobaculum saburreum]|uniref:RNA-binding protein KhpB n=2 Tax=Lachnoanaerobaculum TaxID=1164882 RepID=A0A133ZF04_9FIRM|nr:RNA-binding cell elongation regulator Jag/EloR [Lachnoanaerobaculum saburreum]KXB54024.1 r3H domain protein [Lachnoanaerobaculum saburreum]